jgi:transposase
VSSAVLQQTLADLNTAYRSFFASATGTRKGPKVAPPRFRSRKDRRQAVRFTANSRFRVLGNGRLRLPKIGDVEVRWSRALPAVPTSVTVIRDAAGRYFASFVVEAGREPLPETGRECGIDLGLAHFAVLGGPVGAGAGADAAVAGLLGLRRERRPYHRSRWRRPVKREAAGVPHDTAQAESPALRRRSASRNLPVQGFRRGRPR